MNIKNIKLYKYDLIFFIFIRFPAILLVKTIDSFKNWLLIFSYPWSMNEKTDVHIVWQA